MLQNCNPMNSDLVDLVTAFVNKRELRERLGYNVDTCIKRRIVPLPLPLSVDSAHLTTMWREQSNAYVRSIGTNCIEISILDNINSVVVKMKRQFGPDKSMYLMSVTSGVTYSLARSTEDHLFAVGTSSTCVCRKTWWDEVSVYGPSNGRYVGPGDIVFPVNYIRNKLE